MQSIMTWRQVRMSTDNIKCPYGRGSLISSKLEYNGPIYARNRCFSHCSPFTIRTQNRSAPGNSPVTLIRWSSDRRLALWVSNQRRATGWPHGTLYSKGETSTTNPLDSGADTGFSEGGGGDSQGGPLRGGGDRPCRRKITI